MASVQFPFDSSKENNTSSNWETTVLRKDSSFTEEIKSLIIIRVDDTDFGNDSSSSDNCVAETDTGNN